MVRYYVIRCLCLISERARSLTLLRASWLVLSCAASVWALFQCYRIDSATLGQLAMIRSIRRAQNFGIEINGLPGEVFRSSKLECLSQPESYSHSGRVGLIFVTAPGCSGCQEAMWQWAALLNVAPSRIDRVVIVASEPSQSAKDFIQRAALQKHIPWEVRGIENVEAFETATGIVTLPNVIVFTQDQDVLLAAVGVLTEKDRRTAQALLLGNGRPTARGISLFGFDTTQLAVPPSRILADR